MISKVTWTFKGSTKNYLLGYDGNKADDQVLVDNGSLSVTIK